MTAADSIKPPPKDNLVRGVYPLEVRAASGGERPVLFGHFARFNEWTHIESAWEGEFMERIAPGAFAKTFAENRANIRVTFNHGKDPSMGDKVLGPIDALDEDEIGARYEVPLFPSIDPLLLDGLEAGQYGASFRFRSVKEDFDTRAVAAEHNPNGLPERTIREAQVPEFGPVTYPAYSGATAGIRSLTDDFILAQLVGDPERMRALLDQFVKPTTTPALVTGAEVTHSPAPSRIAVPPRQLSQEDFLAAIETRRRE